MSFKTVLFLSAGILISFGLLMFISKQQSTSHQAPYELLWKLNPKGLSGQGINFNKNDSCAYQLTGPKSMLFKESLSALSNLPVSEIKLHFKGLKPAAGSTLFVLLKSGTDEKIIRAQKFIPEQTENGEFAFLMNNKEAMPSNQLQVVLYSNANETSCFNSFYIESLAAQN
jgi:hypothetical protein